MQSFPSTQPSAGFGSPSAGFGQPSAEFGSPSAGFGSPSAGFGSPSAGFGSPSAGFSSPPTSIRLPASSNPTIDALARKYHLFGPDVDSRIRMEIVTRGTGDELVAILEHETNPRQLERMAEMAVDSNRTDMLAILFQAGLPIDFIQTDLQGNTLLSRAATEGQDEVIQFLLRSGSQAINLKNFNERTPLLLAVESQHLSTVKLLLLAGADPNVKSVNGKTIYHVAIGAYPNPIQDLDWLQRKIEIITFLFRSGVPGIETPDNHGVTPLHVSMNGSDHYRMETLELVRLVLKLIFDSPTKGESLNAITQWNQTPTDYAINQLIDSVSDSLVNEEEVILPPELVEIINTFRAVGGKINKYLSPETGEIDTERILARIWDSVIGGYEQTEEELPPEAFLARDEIVALLQTPLTEDQLSNLRYPIFFHQSQLSRLLEWA